MIVPRQSLVESNHRRDKDYEGTTQWALASLLAQTLFE